MPGKTESSYNKAKKHGGARRWDEYNKIQKEVNRKLKKAKRAHIADISEAGNK